MAILVGMADSLVNRMNPSRIYVLWPNNCKMNRLRVLLWAQLSVKRLRRLAQMKQVVLPVLSGMKARFRVTGTCVRTIDVEPEYRAIANQSDIEFSIHGYLIDGEVRPGMFVEVRPHLGLGKYYKVHSVEKDDPDPKLRLEMARFYSQHKIPMSPERQEDLKALDRTSYTLTLLCANQHDFQELDAMNLK